MMLNVYSDFPKDQTPSVVNELGKMLVSASESKAALGDGSESGDSSDEASESAHPSKKAKSRDSHPKSRDSHPKSRRTHQQSTTHDVALPQSKQSKPGIRHRTRARSNSVPSEVDPHYQKLSPLAVIRAQPRVATPPYPEGGYGSPIVPRAHKRLRIRLTPPTSPSPAPADVRPTRPLPAESRKRKRDFGEPALGNYPVEHSQAQSQPSGSGPSLLTVPRLEQRPSRSRSPFPGSGTGPSRSQSPFPGPAPGHPPIRYPSYYPPPNPYHDNSQPPWGGPWQQPPPQAPSLREDAYYEFAQWQAQRRPTEHGQQSYQGKWQDNGRFYP